VDRTQQASPGQLRGLRQQTSQLVVRVTPRPMQTASSVLIFRVPRLQQPVL
jgi:hypothetical protein